MSVLDASVQAPATPSSPHPDAASSSAHLDAAHKGDIIIITIFRIPSVQGRHKAFSTCVSHITVVTLYYGSSIFIYVRPQKGNVTDVNKFATVLNTIVTPMLNPFIYSLRNEKVKDSLRDGVNKYVIMLTNLRSLKSKK